MSTKNIFKREFKNGTIVIAGHSKLRMKVVDATSCVKGWKYKLCFMKKDDTVHKGRESRYFFAEDMTREVIPKIVVMYWSGVKPIDLPWTNEYTCSYSKELQSTIIEECLSKGYSVMIRPWNKDQGWPEDGQVIWIDYNGRFGAPIIP